jgi:hypothetical protein
MWLAKNQLYKFAAPKIKVSGRPWPIFNNFWIRCYTSLMKTIDFQLKKNPIDFIFNLYNVGTVR